MENFLSQYEKLMRIGDWEDEGGGGDEGDEGDEGEYLSLLLPSAFYLLSPVTCHLSPIPYLI
jgi:hypothetical protein